MTHRSPSSPFQHRLRRGVRLALLLAGGSLSLLTAASDPAAAIRLGTPFDEVVATLGQPDKADKSGFGLYQNLYYRSFKIVLRGGVVREVKDLNPPPKVAKVSPAPVVQNKQDMKRPVETRLKPAAEDGQDGEDGRGPAAPIAVAAHVPVPEVVPGPVPPKAAKDLPVPVAPSAPRVAPAPAPAAAPVALPAMPPAAIAQAPIEAVQAQAMTLKAPDALGNVPAAAVQGAQRVRTVAPEHWTLRLEVASLPETVRKAPGYFKGEQPDVFVVAVPASGGTNYHVFYGDFASREAADKAARQLPSAFAHAAVVKYQKLRSLVAKGQ